MEVEYDLGMKKSLPKLTRKQQAFVDKLIAEPKISATKAALATYNVNNDVTAASVASENLRKPQIMAWLADHAKDAEHAITEVMNYSIAKGQESPAYASVGLAAAKDVLDRVHGKATQRIEQTSTSVIIGIDLSRRDGVVVETEAD